jgi:hypothetical protein
VSDVGIISGTIDSGFDCGLSTSCRTFGGSSIMGEPVRRGGGDSSLSELFFTTLLDSESLTDRRADFCDVFKPVGGPNRVLDLALGERTTFGT